MDNLPGNEMQDASLALNQASRDYLLETAKWARFLAIVGFVFISLMTVAVIAVALYSSSLVAVLPIGGGIFFIVYLIIMSSIYVFPILFLYRFANHTKLVVKSSDIEQLSTGLKNLKSLYKFMGIMMIVVLIIYGLMFLLGGASAIMGLAGGG